MLSVKRKKTHNYIKSGFNILKIYIILISIFLASIFAAYSIPNNNIKSNVKDSVAQLKQEGVYPKLFFGSKSAQLDNFTDSWMLNLAFTPNGKDVINSSLSNIYTNMDAEDNIENLSEAVENQEGGRVSSYSRYWHGYLTILRPLLAFFNYTQIRFLNMCILFGLFLIVSYLLKHKIGTGVMLSFFMTMMSSMFIIVPMSIQFSSMFYIMFISCIIVLTLHEYINKNNYLKYIFFIIGCVTSFFDLLTTPIITIGIPLNIWILLDINKSKEDKSILSRIFEIVRISILWAIGYGITWASKWIIASIVLNKDVVKEALDQILFRTSSTHGEIELSMLSVIKSNILVTLDSIPLKMITLLLIAWLIVFILYKKKSGEIIKSVSILLIALMPIAWYIVLKNHSSIHCWFTYRSLSVSIFALMSFLFFAIDEEKIKIKFNNKNFYS